MNIKTAHSSQKPLILAVETSGRTGSVALAQGPEILTEVTFSGIMKHSAELLPAAAALLERFGQKPADIEHVYISIGPGSFTGLRIAVAFAKTMHMASSTRIVTVDTLDIIAANAPDSAKVKGLQINSVATILDAKRGQFYIAVFESEDGQLKKIVLDCLMTAEQFLRRFTDPKNHVWLLGEGLLYYKDKFAAEGIKFLDESCWVPKASKLCELGFKKALAGKFADPLTLSPKYLRKPEAKIKSI